MDDTSQDPSAIQSSAGSANIPYHRHGGGDGPLIPLNNVSGYLPMVTTTPTFVPSGSIATSVALNSTTGQIFYYDFTNRAWKSVTATTFVPPRVISITTAASYTINTDLYDCLSITALAGTINTIDVSGSPVDFQKLIIRIKDNGSAQTIDWSTNFLAYGTPLPSTTVISKVLTIGFIYDSVATKWGCVASQQQ